MCVNESDTVVTMKMQGAEIVKVVNLNTNHQSNGQQR